MPEQPQTVTADRLKAYAAHPWLMHRGHLEALMLRIAQAGPVSAEAMAARAPKPVKFRREGARAIIPVQGIILPEADWFLDFIGYAYTSVQAIDQMLAEALADTSISEIALYVSSPGGLSTGVQEMGDKLFAARRHKPVTAHVSEIGASAAYWFAAQAETISANPMAQIGSIGVYIVVPDMSRMAEGMGIQIHVIASGDLKGQGVDGAPVTDEYLASVQEVVDGMASIFIGAVARGRNANPERVAALATGGVWLAEPAVRVGLIDEAANWEDVQSREPRSQVREPGSRLIGGGHSMAKEADIYDVTPEAFAAKHPEAVKAWKDEAALSASNEAVAAERKRAGDLKAAFPGREEFVLSQIVAGADLSTAKVALADVLLSEVQALTEKLAKVESKAAAQPAPKPAGTGPAAPAAHSDDAARAEAEAETKDGPKTYEEACEKYRTVHQNASKREMHGALSEQHPKLHADWLERMKTRNR